MRNQFNNHGFNPGKQQSSAPAFTVKNALFKLTIDNINRIPL